MITTIAIQTHIGLNNSKASVISVEQPDRAGDMRMTIQPQHADSYTVYLRAKDARQLARVLLQLAEEE